MPFKATWRAVSSGSQGSRCSRWARSCLGQRRGGRGFGRLALGLCLLAVTGVLPQPVRAAGSDELRPVWPLGRMAGAEPRQLQLAQLLGPGLRELSALKGGVPLVPVGHRRQRSASPAELAIELDRPSGLPWASGNACRFTQFEQHRGRLSDVYTVFLGRESRSGVVRRLRQGSLLQFVGRPGRVVISWPMLPDDVRLQFSACASGAFDSYVRDAAVAIRSTGITNPLVRVGWEPNGQFPWSLGKAPAEWPNYNACFRRQTMIFRSELPDSLIVWDIRRDTNKAIRYDPLNFYPGDEYVDIIGMMLYDRWPVHPDQAAWDSSLRLRKYGFFKGIDLWYEYAVNVAQKPFAVTEWGVSNNDNDPRSFDNPFFITKVFEWLQSRKDNLAYEAYFNCGSSGHEITPATNNPLSSAEYRRLYLPAAP